MLPDYTSDHIAAILREDKRTAGVSLTRVLARVSGADVHADIERLLGVMVKDSQESPLYKKWSLRKKGSKPNTKPELCDKLQ